MYSTPLLLFSRYTARCEAHEVLSSIRDMLEAAPFRMGIALDHHIDSPSWGVHPDRPLTGAVTKDHCARWKHAPVAQVTIRRPMSGGQSARICLDAYIYPDAAGRCVTVFCYRDVTAERFIVACDPGLADQYEFTENQTEALLVSLRYRLLNPDEFSG